MNCVSDVQNDSQPLDLVRVVMFVKSDSEFIVKVDVIVAMSHRCGRAGGNDSAGRTEKGVEPWERAWNHGTGLPAWIGVPLTVALVSLMQMSQEVDTDGVS